MGVVSKEVFVGFGLVSLGGGDGWMDGTGERVFGLVGECSLLAS